MRFTIGYRRLFTLGEIFKRFRFSLYFLIVMVVYFVAVPLESDSGWFAALVLFVFFPGAVITFIWALYRAIKDIVLHIGGEPWPESETIGEIRFVVGIYDFITDEIDSIRSMSGRMRVRFFLFTIGGILLAVLGLAIIIVGAFSYVLIAVGTVVLILGIALVKLASPDHYSGVASGFEMHDNHKGFTTDELYGFITAMNPECGLPDKIVMINSKKECLAWKAADDFVITVYPTAHDEGFYVYKSQSYVVKEYLTQNGNGESLADADDLYREVNELIEACLRSGDDFK